MKHFKPAIITELEKGKLLSAFPGFVDTWNWIVSCISNIKDSDGNEINGIKQGAPVLPSPELTIEGDNSATAKGKKVIFKSAEDSDVKFTVANDQYGNVVVTIGVYYK